MVVVSAELCIVQRNSDQLSSPPAPRHIIRPSRYVKPPDRSVPSAASVGVAAVNSPDTTASTAHTGIESVAL